MPNITLQQTSPPRCLTHYTIGHRRQLNTHYHQTTYPSSPQSTYDMTTDYNKTDFHQLQEILLDISDGRHRVRCHSDHNTHQHTHCQLNFYKHHTDCRQAEHTKGQDA